MVQAKVDMASGKERKGGAACCGILPWRPRGPHGQLSQQITQGILVFITSYHKIQSFIAF